MTAFRDVDARVAWPACRAPASPLDRAQLAHPMRPWQTEFNWFIFEAGRYAGLVSLHRTGPRPTGFELGLSLLPGLPILSPVRVATDDRPLLMVALYDLASRSPPIVVERDIEHARFDARTFSAATADGAFELRQYAPAGASLPPGLAAFFGDAGHVASICARDARFELELHVRPRKPLVTFGARSPELRHGRISTRYAQRPRVDVAGSVRLGDAAAEPVVGDGVQDRQWLEVTRPNLKWMWPHLRLADGRELTGYVIRDSMPGRHADADDGDELGRAGWVIDAAGAVTPTRFDVRALAHVDTERGRVPVRFAVAFPDLGVEVELAHVVPAPFVRMRAFGDAIDAGIYEGPIEPVPSLQAHGWVEVMNAAHARFSARPRTDPRRRTRGRAAPGPRSRRG